MTALSNLLAKTNQSNRYLTIMNMSKDFRTITLVRLASHHTSLMGNKYLAAFRKQGLIN